SQPPHPVPRLVALIPFFFPWVTVIVIPKRLPKTRFILVQQSETTNPLCALPKIEVRDQQSCRAAVLGSERLSLIGVSYPRLPAQYILDRKIRGVTTITKGYYIVGMMMDLGQQFIDRDAFPICIQFGQLRDTMDVSSHRLRRKATKFVPGPALPLIAPLTNRKIPSRERSMRCRPCREYGKPLFKILPRREPCAEITLLTTTSEPRREGSLTHFLPPSL